MAKQALAILHANHARRDSRKRGAKLPQKRHMVNHLAERIYFPPQATLDKFAREFGGPPQNMAGSRQGGGYYTNQISQPALAALREIAVSRILPTH